MATTPVPSSLTTREPDNEFEFLVKLKASLGQLAVAMNCPLPTEPFSSEAVLLLIFDWYWSQDLPGSICIEDRDSFPLLVRQLLEVNTTPLRGLWIEYLWFNNLNGAGIGKKDWLARLKLYIQSMVCLVHLLEDSEEKVQWLAGILDSALKAWTYHIPTFINPENTSQIEALTRETVVEIFDVVARLANSLPIGPAQHKRLKRCVEDSVKTCGDVLVHFSPALISYINGHLERESGYYYGLDAPEIFNTAVKTLNIDYRLRVKIKRLYSLRRTPFSPPLTSNTSITQLAHYAYDIFSLLEQLKQSAIKDAYPFPPTTHSRTVKEFEAYFLKAFISALVTFPLYTPAFLITPLAYQVGTTIFHHLRTFRPEELDHLGLSYGFLNYLIVWGRKNAGHEKNREGAFGFMSKKWEELDVDMWMTMLDVDRPVVRYEIALRNYSALKMADLEMWVAVEVGIWRRARDMGSTDEEIKTSRKRQRSEYELVMKGARA